MERAAHTGAMFLGRARDPTRVPHWSSLFLKDCTLWNRPTLEQFMESHGKNLRLEQGKSVRSPACEEKRAAETASDELIQPPFPIPCATVVGDEAEKSSVK
ncbi:hypothetical protein TURU_168923 [Turdus rufiventris]|nr:hypothetical protein TURU_168923 [Turdus rufiventris]